MSQPGSHDPASFAARFPWLLTGMAQPPPEVVPVAVPIIGDMKNFLTGPHGRMARWGAGITLAGFLAGGGFAVAAAASGPAAAPAATTSLAASTSNSDLNALLS